MEIDLDLVRALILWADAGDFFSDIPGYEDQEDKVKFHKGLLMERGFLIGKMLKNSTVPTSIPQNVVVRGLGNIGKEFVELVQNDSDWDANRVEILRLIR